MMIAAFDSLARKHAKEMDEAQEAIVEYQALCDDLLAALRDAKLTIEALYGDLVEVTGVDFEVRENTADTMRKVEAAIAKATTVEVDGDDDEDEGEG